MGATGLIQTPGPTLMLNERGGPVPPQDVLQRIRSEVGPEFGLRFMADFDGSHWAFVREWPNDDKRWDRVRCQEIPPDAAYDIIGYLPLDCPLEQAADYARKALRAYPIEDIRRLADRVSSWNNDTIPQQQITEVVTDAVDDTLRGARQQNPRRTKHIIETVVR